MKKSRTFYFEACQSHCHVDNVSDFCDLEEKSYLAFWR